MIAKSLLGKKPAETIYRMAADGVLYIDDEDHIDVNLDTGWDVYEYKLTAEGAEQVAFHRFGGIYKVYAMIAAVMVIFSIVGGIYGIRTKKKYEEQRKKGLRQ